jgi:chromosomal replication initiator protein
LTFSTLEHISENDTTVFYEALKREIKSDQVFKMWFENTQISLDSEGKPLLLVPNTFSRQWILKKFSKQLSNLGQKLWNNEIKCEIKTEKTVKMPQNELATKDEGLINSIVKPKVERFDGFSFSDYVAGVENQLAYYAAKNIYQEESYNCPFTIVGDHGTGKTHLASAIVNGMSKNSVSFLHAEEFANSYISSVISNNIESFRNSIRSKKVFIIEDLDFILEGNKKKTIEELIQTIKILKREKRLIIITSTHPLNEYETVSPKLVNILLSGLKVRVISPSEETRRNIIEKYLKNHKVKLRPKSLKFIESISFKNHRELIGALKQLATFSKLKNEILALNVVKEILADHLYSSTNSALGDGDIDLHSIAQCVSNRYGVSVQKMMSSSRERHISEARHMAMALSYDYHNTLNEIGLFYGGRLHQSVLYSIKKVQGKRQKSTDFDKLYNKLNNELKG